MGRKFQKKIGIELLPAKSEGSYIFINKNLYLKHKVGMELSGMHVPGPEFEPQYNENK